MSERRRCVGLICCSSYKAVKIVLSVLSNYINKMCMQLLMLICYYSAEVQI